MKPVFSNVPSHLGIIMDGDRTFAKRLMLKPWKGHEFGAKKLQSLLEWCREFKIKELTLYTFSIENFDRPKEEFDMLMKLFEKEGEALLKDPRPHEQKIRFNFIGRLEIIDATKKISKQIKEGKIDINSINEEVFRKNLYLESEPDLIIRTSQSRLSGFLLWQSSYAEIIFLPEVLWPEFNKEHLISCLKEYETRQRKFGK